MRLPILYAVSWPHRVRVDYGRGIDERFDLVQLGSMSFKVPRVRRARGLDHCTHLLTCRHGWREHEFLFEMLLTSRGDL